MKSEQSNLRRKRALQGPDHTRTLGAVDSIQQRTPALGLSPTGLVCPAAEDAWARETVSSGSMSMLSCGVGAMGKQEALEWALGGSWESPMGLPQMKLGPGLLLLLPPIAS